MFKFQKTIYIILHLIILFSLGFALMIYTSLNKNVPWYDAYGMQFLSIFIICVPILLVVGIALQILNTKYRIIKSDLLLPFYSSAGIAIPILIDEGLNDTTLTVGIICCFSSIILTIAFAINQFRKDKYHEAY
ncbi:MAG: hypothetical protein VB095_00615 [Anaerovorax sp.]|nr:hypothetical protein [Anaerovorax sp.]